MSTRQSGIGKFRLLDGPSDWPLPFSSFFLYLFIFIIYIIFSILYFIFFIFAVYCNVSAHKLCVLNILWDYVNLCISIYVFLCICIFLSIY